MIKALIPLITISGEIKTKREVLLMLKRHKKVEGLNILLKGVLKRNDVSGYYHTFHEAFDELQENLPEESLLRFFLSEGLLREDDLLEAGELS